MSEIKYTIIYSGRRSISIAITPDKGVTVRAPYRTSVNAIEKYVKEKSPWIHKHIQRFSGLIRISRLQYKNGEPLLFLGTELTLKIITANHPFVRISDSYLEVGVNNAEDIRGIRILIEKWYREQARETFSYSLKRLLDANPQYGFRLQGFVIRTLKSRWGSCNSHGRITLNSQLVKLSETYIDYVIIHELCHLKHHNHGKEFHRLLGELVPDYKTIRKNLRDYLMN